MRLSLTRWLLSPATSWRARKLVAASKGRLDFDAAWRRTRLVSRPDELPYQRYGHRAPDERET
ncbi:hypothetical protein [Streptomyces sp. SM10]|uniref:hypothetical protein n=1 Tax=Streptomyces sp. SM10 TaxID=565556 RepID=UPI0011B0373C|nr:hypothetical protein [Streptomyces sp. SM10]